MKRTLRPPGGTRKLKRKPRVSSPTSRPPRRRPPVTTGGTPSNGQHNDQIRIRMYRVGFGDSFLLSLPVAGGAGESTTERHILVDCGVHAKGDIGTIEKVVSNIAETTENKLAIVIATHAHQDHIAGFDRFADAFSKFEIGEVWLPWTWDPNNPAAVKLQKKHAALVDGLAEHFSALSGSRAAASGAAAAAVQNLRGNAHAIALLKAGFGVGAKVRYVKAGDTLTEPAEVKGLSVRFLGPPQSQEFLAQMDPPAGQRYLRLTIGGALSGASARPFGDPWCVNRKSPPSASMFPSKDEKQLEEVANSPADELAFALDQARNNESVVAQITYRAQTLLFPGDAQYGNWRWWLENDQADQILSGVKFLKVAHHGSVNATPKNALEKMTDGGFAAMVSTQSTPWPSIPRIPLMQRLSAKTKQRVVRSDWLAIKDAPEPSRNSAPQKPATLPLGFTEGALWFDYVLPL